MATMEANGNALINDYFEKHVPAYYRRPSPSDPQFVFVSFFVSL